MNELLDQAVLALRDETGVQEDGVITAQRLEAAWMQRRARGRALPRITAVAAATLMLGGGAVAATNLVLRARLAKPDVSSVASAPSRASSRPLAPAPAVAVVVPPAVDTSAPAEPSPDQSRTAFAAATAAYAAAHRAHFVSRNWSQALALWTRYLRLAPHGPLSSEAHFNRAICLLHLDRRDEAAVELQPFARGRWRGYRQSEARELLEALGAPMRDAPATSRTSD